MVTSDLPLVLREFCRSWRVTGTVAPSSRFLARALARYVPQPADQAAVRRVLEVGSGTGAVTKAIAESLGPHDTLDLVEVNDRFVARLRERLLLDRSFTPVASRTRVWRQSVEELSGDARYDVIISGLPLNNFPVDQARSILAKLMASLAPGGVFSFFEYVWARPLKVVVSGRDERQRIRGIDRAYRELIEAHGFRRELVFVNLPPAWVHYLRKDSNPIPNWQSGLDGNSFHAACSEPDERIMCE